MQWGMTPLMLAAKQGHLELMRYLVVNAKADVNIRAEKVAIFIVSCIIAWWAYW